MHQNIQLVAWLAVSYALAIANSADAFAQSINRWEHNGSVMTLVAQGTSRVFFYEAPRSALLSQGVVPGTLLFGGRKEGNKYIGDAYVFSEKCGAAKYDVQGDVSPDEHRITLRGVAPVRNESCQIDRTRNDTLVFHLLPSQAVGPPIALLCNFEAALVPCEKLPVPVSPGFTSIELRYKFVKYVPVWPNQEIFGGRAKSQPIAFDPKASSQEPFLKSQQEFHNRVEIASAGKQTIESQPLSTNLYNAVFVDPELARSKYGVGFQGPAWQPFESRLINTNANIYRGAEVFEAWKRSLSVGIICSDTVVKSEDGEASHSCAFTRSNQTSNQTTIEYCSYTEGNASKIRSVVDCIAVAREKGATRSVLSVLYTIHDVGGAGGELELKCVIPQKSIEESAKAVSAYLRSYLGPSGGFLAQPLLKSFKFEALKVEEKDERMFMRVVLRGSLDPPGSDSPPLLTVVTSFTVSAQSSDNIIDYREPSSAMGNRIVNRFLKQLDQGMRAFVSTAQCEASLY